MSDDGGGDPDLTAGDGIYSLVLAGVQGQYRVRVEVGDGGGGAFTVREGGVLAPQPLALAVPVCCGSEVPVPQGRMEYVGRFHRVHTGPHIQPGGGGRGVGRVGDLTVQCEGLHCTARWGAVWGEVQGWQLVYAPSPSPLLAREGKGVGVLEAGEVTGEEGSLSYTFHLVGEEGGLYLGLRAVGGEGRGRVSNLVAVTLRVEGGEGGEQPTSSPTKGGTNWVVLGAALGAVLVLLLSLLSLVLCLLWRRRRRKSSDSLHGFSTTRSSGVNVHIPSPSHSISTASSSASNSPFKAITSSPLVPVMCRPMEGQELGSKEQEPGGREQEAGIRGQEPGGRGDCGSRSMAHLTPTYWSASQLLAEHEQRVVPGSLGVQPLYYTTVPEQPVVREGGRRQEAGGRGQEAEDRGKEAGDRRKEAAVKSKYNRKQGQGNQYQTLNT